MKHLHLVTTDKFIEPYIKFINCNFNKKEHYFLSFNSSSKNFISENHINLSFQNKVFCNWKILREMYASKAIYLHALFDIKILVILFLQPWLLKKCYWVVWGADLYKYRNRNFTYKSRIQESIRRFVIKRFAGLITHVRGDYELAKKWYNIQGNYFYSFLYPSNLFKEVHVPQTKKNNVYVLIGNSADSSNNHVAIFEQLKNIVNDNNVKFIVPLSYGNKEYIEKVLVKGRELFGDKFEPILNFLSFEDYLKLLAKIDIAIFNHDRQQALGNISSLISLRKKVYIRDDITTWKFCSDHGLKVYSTNNELPNIFELMDEDLKEKNYLNMKSQFSEIKLVEDWSKIFSPKK